MLYLDLRTRKKIREQEKLQEIETTYLEVAIPTKQKANDAVTIQTANQKAPIHQSENKRRMYFLFGASAICFLLAIFTFWFGNLISNTIFTIPHKLVYVAMFIIIGAILLGLACISTSPQEQTLVCLKEEDTPPHIQNEYVKTTNIPEQSISELNEPLAKEQVEEKENLIEIQVQEPCEIEIKKYDVRHPKDVVDSQC
jgi:hypothetical protein